MYRFFYITLISAVLLLFSSCEFFFGSDDKDEYIYDQDGIPDEYEVEGGYFMGFPVYAWGARPEVTDLFIHVSTMNVVGTSAETDAGMLLQKAALDKVVAAFAKENIAIHFDVGTTGLYNGYTPIDSGVYNLSGVNHQVPYNNAITLQQSLVSDTNDIPDYVFVDQYKTAYFPSERNALFYYLTFGSSQSPPDENGDGVGGSSGISYLRGLNFLITLGFWDLHFNDTAHNNLTVNFQASTIMHEFGHTLGLLHGGAENQNYKPNYYSIMNYLYQLNGLPTIGNVEGDRYYYEYSQLGYTSIAYLNNSPITENFVMNYSHGKLAELNETKLDEKDGLGHDDSTSVNWNFNSSSTESGVVYDINGSGSFSVLSDYDDWDNLYFYFDALYNNSGRVLKESEWEIIEEEKPDFSKIFQDVN